MTPARSFVLTALLAFAAAMPGGAIAAPAKTLSCKDLSEGLLKASLTPESKVQSVDRSCLFTNIRFKLATRQFWTVDRLTVAGLATWDQKTEALPPHLQVEAQGIRFSPDIDSARLRYQLALTQKPFDARLQFDWDSGAKAFHLREVALTGPAFGHISLSADAVFPGQDLPSRADFARVRVSRVHFVLDNRMVFESMIMPTLIGLIPEDKDPAVEFPRLQGKAERQVRAMPDNVIDAGSREALISFTRDFPHPTGHFDLDLSFAEPRSLETIKAQGKGEDWAGGVRISARYEPQVAPAP